MKTRGTPRFTRPLARSLTLVAAGLLLCGFRLPLHDGGEVTAVFTAEAERLDEAHPLVGTLEITTRETEVATVANLQDRFKGFAIVEDYEAGRVAAGGKARAAWRYRLTPEGVGPWRLLPFVITLRDTRTGAERAVLTRVADFPPPLPLPPAEGAPECDLQPEWIAPGWRTIGLWGLMVVLAGAGIGALVPLARRLRRVLHERTLPPEARARLELERLLAEGLVAQGRIKLFYFGLTGVVRRYFERGYGLRATRQTTEEFLARLATDDRFGAAERRPLEEFLTAADRIKFADITASAEEANAAVTLAQATIEQDATRRRESAARGGAVCVDEAKIV